jgi:hypothetical protein
MRDQASCRGTQPPPPSWNSICFVFISVAVVNIYVNKIGVYRVSKELGS